MDGLSAAASVIAVIQISGQVIDLCHTYYSHVKDARTDIQRLCDETASLRDVLSKLADLARAPGSVELSVFGLLNQPDGPVQQCLTNSIGLVAKLNPGQGTGEMKQFGWRALKWPFTSKEVDKAVAAIGRHKATFNLALAADQTALVLAIRQGMTEGLAVLRQQSEATQIAVADTRAEVGAARADIVSHRIDEYREKIIHWLTTTDPSSNYHAAHKKRQPTTGEWLIKRPEFEEWKRTRKSLLWLHGIPGCGKTILSSTVIEHLEAYCKAEPGLAIAYFYFDFNDAEKQNTTNCVSSLIAQLCRDTLAIPETLKDLYRKCNQGNSKPEVRSLTAVLRHFAMADEQDIFIVLDALDECPRDEVKELRNELLELVTEIKSWSTSNIHLLVTSRQELDIKAKLVPLLTAPAISIAGAEVEVDIKKHIENQLATDPKLKGWSDDIKVHIERTLAEKAHGMFRWVFCQLDALKRCRKKKALLEALESLPKTLDDTYERILANIENAYQNEARRALIWLAFSQRPLLIEELAEAAVVDPNVSPPFDPEERLHDPCNDIFEILGSLVTISSRRVLSNASDDSLDSESDSTADVPSLNLPNITGGEVRLAHFSVKEYLLSNRIGASSVSEFRATSVEADKFISQSCLLYIFHYDELESRTTSPEDLEYFPLLQYACELWYVHARLVPEGSRESLGPVILELFLSETALITWLQVHRPDYDVSKPFKMEPKYGLPLHYASCIGLEAVVQRLLEDGADVNAKYTGTRLMGFTALHFAAENGQEAVVRQLLEHQAVINAKDSKGRTALYLAARNNREAVVRQLCEYNADVNAKNNKGKTALYRAARWGDEAVLHVLLEYQADVNAKSNQGDTALHIAANAGREAVIQLLLEYKADVNARDDEGKTALHEAAFGGVRGHEAAARLLLEHKADIEAIDVDGRTALHSVAMRGREEIVRLLLEYKANLEAKDVLGMTALHYAVFHGREDIVRLLLENKADLEAKDNHGYTAIHWAATNRYMAIVRLLLENKADLEAKNNDGKTALHSAAMRGREEIVRLLLEYEPDLEAKDKEGKTALHCVAEWGKKDIVRLLLEHKADPEAKDIDGKIAMHLAVMMGREDIVRLLLKYKVADVEAKDIDGKTAMDLAAKEGNNAIVSLLREAKRGPQ